MYEWDYRIRYSECSPDGSLTMPGMLALFQDVGYRHADEAGRGISYTRESGCTYYLLSWHIELYKKPIVGENVKLSTWFSAESESLASKSIVCQAENGDVLAAGDTRWAYMDVIRKMPAIPPEGLWHGEEKAPPVRLSAHPRRLRFSGGEPLESIIVKHEDTDTNRHVNNVRFVYLAARAGEIDFDAVRSLSVEYRREAYEGDLLRVGRIKNDSMTDILLSHENGEPAALFRFAF